MIDLAKTECVSETNALRFGLCDNENQTPAFVSYDAQADEWIATVLNENEVDVTFIAVDNCIDVLRANGEMDNRCDVILSYTNNIVFVELKNKRADWIQDGFDQIEQTIINISNNVGYTQIKKKKAFVANRRRPHFHVLDTATKQRFFTTYRVRVHVEATIKI